MKQVHIPVIGEYYTTRAGNLVYTPIRIVYKALKEHEKDQKIVYYDAQVIWDSSIPLRDVPYIAEMMRAKDDPDPLFDALKLAYMHNQLSGLSDFMQRKWRDDGST